MFVSPDYGERLDGIGDRSIDFVYSSIVLQHIPRPYSLAYLREFCRVIRPGGLIVFQIPTTFQQSLSQLLGEALHLVRTQLAIRTRLKQLAGGKTFFALDRKQTPGRIEMHCVPKAEIVTLLNECGLDIVFTPIRIRVRAISMVISF